MPHRIALLELVPVPIQCVLAYAKIAWEKFAQVGFLLRRGQHLNAVAGREHHPLFRSRLLHQIANSLRQAGLGNGEPLPHFQRSAVMVYANELKVHGETNLCTELSPLAARTTKAVQNAQAAI